MSKTNDAQAPGFGSFIVAFILPFVYFFSRGRTGAGLVALILCAAALPLMFFGIGFVLWFFVVLWAIFGIRGEMAKAQISQLGSAIAQAQAQAANSAPATK